MHLIFFIGVYAIHIQKCFVHIKVIILNIFLGNLAFLKIVFMSHILVCIVVTHSSSLLYNTPFYLNMEFFHSVNGCWSYFQFYILTNCAAMKTFVFISFAKTETLSRSADHFWHKWVMSVSRNSSLLPSDWPGQGLGWPEPLTGSSYPWAASLDYGSAYCEIRTNLIYRHSSFYCIWFCCTLQLICFTNWRFMAALHWASL